MYYDGVAMWRLRQVEEDIGNVNSGALAIEPPALAGLGTEGVFRVPERLVLRKALTSRWGERL